MSKWDMEQRREATSNSQALCCSTRIRKHLVNKDGFEFVVHLSGTNIKQSAMVQATVDIKYLRMAAARPANDCTVSFPRLNLNMS